MAMMSSVRRCSLTFSTVSSLRRSLPIAPRRLLFPFSVSRTRISSEISQELSPKAERGDDDDGSTIETVDRASVRASAVSLMEAAVESLSRELSKLRTGRASPGMCDHIIVETSGVKMPLSRMAVTSVIDSKTLSVTPYDPNTLKELESAIVSSPLGLNPKPDGNRLIAPIPPLTKEHMQAVCKVVAKSSEDVKQSIRRARQKALNTVKKAGSIFSKDDVKKFEKEVDELTRKFIKSAEDMCKGK